MAEYCSRSNNWNQKEEAMLIQLLVKGNATQSDGHASLGVAAGRMWLRLGWNKTRIAQTAYIKQTVNESMLGVFLIFRKKGKDYKNCWAQVKDVAPLVTDHPEYVDLLFTAKKLADYPDELAHACRHLLVAEKMFGDALGDCALKYIDKFADAVYNQWDDMACDDIDPDLFQESMEMVVDEAVARNYIKLITQKREREVEFNGAKITSRSYTVQDMCRNMQYLKVKTLG